MILWSRFVTDMSLPHLSQETFHIKEDPPRTEIFVLVKGGGGLENVLPKQMGKTAV